MPMKVARHLQTLEPKSVREGRRERAKALAKRAYPDARVNVVFHGNDLLVEVTADRTARLYRVTGEDD